MSGTGALELARELAFHMLNGAWARDDVALLSLVQAETHQLDNDDWRAASSTAQKDLVKGLLLKAADSDWSWEISTLTGREPSEFRAALERSLTNEADA